MQGIYLYRPWDRAHHPVDAATRAPDYLASWLKAFPDSQPKVRDFEDWSENAVILHEATVRGLPLTILPAGQAGYTSTSGFEMPVSDDAAPVGAMFGLWGQFDFRSGLPVPIRLVGQDARSASTASMYAKSPVFLRNAGRTCVYSAATSESFDEAVAAVMGDRPEADVFIKTVRKESADLYRFEAGRSYYDQLGEQNEDIVWDFVRFEGNRDMLLVQGAIECRYEYRFFVIDGKVVTGGGCVEHHTPLDCTETFDAKMAPSRNRSEVGSYPEVRDQHLAFALRFAAEFEAEHGPGLDYCLDVCLDGEGRSAVIELNPPLNCGRYARDVGVWMDAIVARTEAHAA
jgi:hypothetical protein